MPSNTKSIIEQVVSGKSSKYLIDAIVEELPPFPMIRSSLQRELPKGSIIRVDESTFFIKVSDKEDRHSIDESLEIFRSMYPELEFVID